MFVHAHPDDESSKAASTMARYADEGHRVSVVTLTDGMAGDILNPAKDEPGIKERLGEVRRAELAHALEVLGVTDHFAFGYPDSGFVEGFEGDGGLLAPNAFYNQPLEEVTARLVEVIRSTRPHVIVTYPEDGGYPHPDHIRCHDVSAAAFEAAGDPEAYPEAGAPWTPQKLYYCHPFTRPKLEALHDACEERGLESPYGEMLARRRSRGFDDPVTTRVEVADYLEHRRKALLAHETQVDPNGRWFAVPDEIVREVYPYEDFTLARSRVGVSIPEAGLFDGLEAVHASRRVPAA
ncbi:mycothiol conjugate amidase Mca [Egibacter rhizosphaerae]|uniref:Mycothiol conjugate amidase Mca n=2 Tax=Egibacter rhizosphaerae TaxID=1670831 RepID=A0A411YL57_9ACTN|nr:mycothiol conjugate amidase Mca [Egibacter rhizosphaerae]